MGEFAINFLCVHGRGVKASHNAEQALTPPITGLNFRGVPQIMGIYRYPVLKHGTIAGTLKSNSGGSRRNLLGAH